MWCAPLLWRAQLRSVLIGYVHRGWLDLATDARIADEAEAHLPGHESAFPSTGVLQRAAQSACSAYDCESVVLAEELAVALVTADHAVLAAFPDVACPL